MNAVGTAILALTLALLIFGLVLNLKSRSVSLRNGRVWLNRDAGPVTYWAWMTFHAAVIVAVVYALTIIWAD